MAAIEKLISVCISITLRWNYAESNEPQIGISFLCLESLNHLFPFLGTFFGLIVLIVLTYTYEVHSTNNQRALPDSSTLD